MANKTKLTETQKQDYISNGGVECPYCGSDDITTGNTDYGDGDQITKVSCNACNREWFDIYTLVGVEEE